MKFLVPFSILLLAGISSNGQEATIQRFIDAWKVADTSQSHRAQVFYDELTFRKDTASYERVVQHLHAYLSKRPDTRLEVRTIMYQVLGALEFKYPLADYFQLMQKAIKMAHSLRDDQLVSELYSLCAELYDYKDYNYILYNYKAIELQRRIGFSHFSYVHHRFFVVSSTLYRSQEYRQAIGFGLEGLSFRKSSLQHWNPKINILQFDILGAAYKKLGLYDSSRYYYEKLISALDTDSLTPAFQELWTGIANGNIGHSLLLQQQPDRSLPFIIEHLQVSRKMGDTLNIALSQNALGLFYLQKRKYTDAIATWKQAYRFSLKVSAIEPAMQAAQSMADVFRMTGDKDSAFYYYDRYHRHKEELMAPIRNTSLSAVNAQVAFDDLQHSLMEAQLIAGRERNTRNALVAGILFMSIITILLYNRRRLKEKHRRQLEQGARETAQLEVKNARMQIASFTKDIIEKNNLIETLNQQLVFHEKNQHHKKIAESLAKYTLLTNADWEKFRAEFARAYPAFLKKIRQQLTQITPSEERLATLIYLQFSNAQIANTLGISKESVARSKRRLTLRFQLPDDLTIEQFLLNNMIIKD